MKILFDTTVNQFDEKASIERNKLQISFDKLLLEQRQERKDFETNYTFLVQNKIIKLEDNMNKLRLGQA